MEAVRAVERQARVASPGRAPGRAGREEHRVRRLPRAGVRRDHRRSCGRTLRLRPDHEERRSCAVRASLVGPAFRPRPQVGLALRERGRALLQHDGVPRARARSSRAPVERPVLLEADAARSDRPELDRVGGRPSPRWRRPRPAGRSSPSGCFRRRGGAAVGRPESVGSPQPSVASARSAAARKPAAERRRRFTARS